MTTDGIPSTPGASRPLRADARRNREQLIQVARALFSEQGIGAPLDTVATRAGVGPGTLYRHFPTRQALLDAVFRDRIETLSRQARELLDAPSPGAALREWLRMALADAGAIHSLTNSASITFQDEESGHEMSCNELLHRAAGSLLARAQQAGEIRADLTTPELINLVAGILAVTEDHTGDRTKRSQAVMDRMLTLMMEGVEPRTSSD
ncbi:TetR/AcrR family transcriptional regulator [Actinoalloteichus hymeniacidonis]|uniref:Transcriptional regulator, TetR family n=1 Tax=Actinoalloteichus hymeniacidonis TaxID=340345 RepID=A0AAC9HLW4_9PSEU|nr:TetR/AcrR family transcriptional regulator [Actinoalloteichus hymeniacidonis]AOS61280.1 transcriptional regulator, TetR family [Actinoalloteichus hymeniacidonis]MBB5910717.1 AcrR family transcriptional regulator [Actinoalloteichus hymeniacidonis]